MLLGCNNLFRTYVIAMTYKIVTEYVLQRDEKGFSRGKAQTTIQTADEQQDIEVLFIIKDELKNGELERASEYVTSYVSQLQNITIHPTLITQLTLIRAGAQLVFHRDDPTDNPEFKFHTVAFHYNMMTDSFTQLTKDESDGMKPARQFKGAVLKGLWYKHVYDASVSGMATNILNEMERGDWLMKSFTERFGPLDGTKVFGDEHSKYLAHQLVSRSQKTRAAREGMTGEWIVFEKHDNKLHLLSLASHQEDDTRILRRIGSATLPRHYSETKKTSSLDHYLVKGN